MTDTKPIEGHGSAGNGQAMAAGDGNGELPVLTRKDFVSDQEVRWCPGCGDYSILAQTQKVMPDFGFPKENIVFISGIGCSGRLPYYMSTYGFHTIHGRAPTLATGLKAARPDLMVWVITGDGDALSIGGNHVLHSMRRNVDIKLVMFNNRIYGLTKGQFSPTSELGKVTKSTPLGSVDPPFNPLAVALGAEASFVARSVDVYAQHLQETLTRAAHHKGVAFVEVLGHKPRLNPEELYSRIFSEGIIGDAADAAVVADVRSTQTDISGRAPTRNGGHRHVRRARNGGRRRILHRNGLRAGGLVADICGLPTGGADSVAERAASSSRLSADIECAGGIG